MNTENSKTNNTDKFRLILADKRNLKEKKNLHTARKKTTNNSWLKILLAPYKNKIPKYYKPTRSNIW